MGLLILVYSTLIVYLAYKVVRHYRTPRREGFSDHLGSAIQGLDAHDFSEGKTL